MIHLISTNRASLILVFVDDTRGWVYTVESNVADLQAAAFIAATGGTVATSGDFKIHSFTGDGCFVVSDAGNPIGSTVQ
jgi:cystathionine beta-lyase family protein involved in aluminum resistance